ncbi:MAG: O-antigen ligase family protein [bacterium]|nr:O-antigen ligase family protein [bacterium]
MIGMLEDLKREVSAAFQERSPLERVALGGLAGFLAASPFSISLSQIFVFSAIGAWLASLWMGGQKVRFPLLRPFALFAALTIVSALLSDDPFRSLKDARQLVQILIFYCALNTLRNEKETGALVKVLFGAAAAASAYSLIAALGRPLGLGSRLSGFFSIYMTLGGFLLIVEALALAYLAVPGKNVRKGWVAAAAAVMFAALVATLSRNAWIGLFVAAVILIIVQKSRWATGALLAAVVLAVLIGPASVRDRMMSMTNLKSRAVAERVYLWRSGLAMIGDRPLLGFGLDNIKKNYPRYAHPGALKEKTSHIHNNILQVGAERGLLALAAWLWIWWVFFREAGRRVLLTADARFGRRFLLTGSLIALAGFHAAGMFEYNFGDSEVVMLAYFVMALSFVGPEPGPSGAG